MEYRTIGELACAAGVGIETIRYYERIGLIAKPARGYKGWRRYPDSVLQRVLQIREGKTLGFSLREMLDLLGNSRNTQQRSCTALRATVEAKLGELDVEIARLAACRERLQGFLIGCEPHAQFGNCAALDAIT